jgi:hypothetical protein
LKNASKVRVSLIAMLLIVVMSMVFSPQMWPFSSSGEGNKVFSNVPATGSWISEEARLRQLEGQKKVEGSR